MTSIPALPVHLWNYYVEYLWHYEPNSWIATTAYTCRIMSIIIATPLVILAILDITSYAIARILGVIAETKISSTGDGYVPEDSVAMNGHPSGETPLIEVTPISPTVADRRASTANLPSLDTSSPHPFFASEGEKLSGVGEFSPAASRPPSPVLSRKQLPVLTPLEQPSSGVQVGLAKDEDGITMKKRTKKKSNSSESAKSQSARS
ncbi:hypothetical protein DL96DRAFT_1471742 [Flagelloscypha sp. PMI_526]|nr:hypothetical protein DL96DRAFT_1471742 [Flagelloscypha sp. PMI_526]